ncbi:MAG: class I SAM-dependent methyltransferase [Phycisphaerales bacterium]|nr:MAG: class I SAM-dependent methyltransferase [Phycisphaerales bacterium]
MVTAPRIRNHRAEVGGLWEEIGRLQFNFMVQRGLMPHHYFLDIGCGSLRGGVHFIPYLDRGRYFGIDRQKGLIGAGLRHELDAAIALAKQPRFIHSAMFEFDRFCTRFDFALAQSVFTHLAPDQIGLCLRNLLQVMNPAGSLYATFFRVDQSEPHVQTDDVHAVHRYTRKEMFDLAQYEDWERPTYIGAWNHPRKQVMMRYQPV